jgi:hypothetical protein
LRSPDRNPLFITCAAGTWQRMVLSKPARGAAARVHGGTEVNFGAAINVEILN